MRINELRIHGFKSFANKTTIKFEDNFVGIVGPNGSGKSNIIDAIRWVFGEQSSKSMRGHSSTDIIFGGTQTKNKMNQAEVTLVLDNKDQYLPLEYNEVMLTRRLYRSGESEYLINNVKCRLKDITDLIMDSGMGKNSFSIISQGKIEEIVMSKPLERRTVVEDVAGILKYKKRKETALRKIDKTNENIKQIDLILSEMELRLEPLKRQRENALKYLDLKNSLQTYEVSLLSNRIKENKEQYDGLTEILNKAKEDEVVLNSQINVADQKVMEINNKINSVNSEFNNVNYELENKKRLLNELESQFLILQERKDLLASNEKDKHYAQLNKTLIEKKRSLQNNSALQIETNEEFNIISDKLNKLEVSISDLRSQKYNLTDKIESAKQQSNGNKIPYAVKTVLNNFTEAKLVKNLFECDSKYAMAINITFGGRINEIIFDNNNQIKQAITLLNNNKAGRATFIPLQTVKQYSVDDKLKNTIEASEGFVDYAINLLSFDNKYVNAFNNICATTLIVDNLDNANKLAKKIYNRYRIITLSGELVSTSGTVSGGQNNNFNPLVAQSNLTELEKQFKVVNQKYSETVNAIQGVESEYHRTRTEKDRVDQRIKDINDEIRNIEFELNETKPTEDTSETEDINKQIETLQTEVKQLTITRESINRNIAGFNDEKEELSFEIRNYNEKLKELGKQTSDNNAKYARLEVYLIDDRELLSSEYNMSFEMAYNNAKHNIDLKEYETEVKSLKQKIRSLGVVNTAAIEEYDEIKERFDFINNQKEDSESARDKLLAIIDELDEIVVSQFEETYVKLREEFKNIFSELFGGGYADLVLTEPDDLLNTGVEIVAQPPGKKLQTISLLSGGEKALTAISLLFAILRIRTVPFAILDEVEAALDEANVKRYAKYLSIFSEQTQFLVITHRQGTMEIVDELYGVTMAEKGISSIVNIKLGDENYVDV